jgi:sigma-B regulation protein RsbU (phosphoserine phosphatase)
VKVTAPYETREILIGPGDQLIMFTDGITEARRADGEQFGEQQVSALARVFAGAPPEDVVDRVMDALRAWAGSTPVDDQTIVVVSIVADIDGPVRRVAGSSTD